MEVPRYVERLSDPDVEARVAAAEALGRAGDIRAVEPLVQALRDRHWRVRRFAAEALGRIGDPKAASALTEALRDGFWPVRKAAAVALETIAPPTDPETQAWCAVARQDWGAAVALGETAVEPLTALLNDTAADIAETAAIALTRMGVREACIFIDPGGGQFLEPDGETSEMGLVVAVVRKTGVTYSHQCGGYGCELRSIEGFAVPVGGPSQAKGFIDWFARVHGGHPPFAGTESWSRWTPELIEQLRALVETVGLWWTACPVTCGSADKPASLELDMDRFTEVTEGWVPVKTVYGPGVLIFPNCD